MTAPPGPENPLATAVPAPPERIGDGDGAYRALRHAYDAAGWWARACAFIFDCSLAIAAGVLTGFIANLAGANDDAASALILLAIMGSWLALTSITTVRTGGQTPGKALGGMRVVRDDGRRQTAGGSLLRDSLYRGIFFIGTLPLAFDYLWAVGERHQTLHDKMAGTHVVRTDRYHHRVWYVATAAVGLVILVLVVLVLTS